VAEDDRISLSAFDLSIGIQTWIEATVTEPGAITIPARLLTEIVSRLPNQDVTIENDGLAIELTCGTGKYKMQGHPALAFPALPTLEDLEGIEVECDRLQHAIQQTLFAASTDESKQILTGAQILFSPDGLRLNATDGHRLVVYKEALAIDTEPFSVVIPARALRELLKVLSKGSAVLVKCDRAGSNQISFEVAGENGAECLTCRVLDGTYPAVDQLLPKAFTRQLTVSRAELLLAIDRISVLAARKNNLVKMEIGKENLLGRSLFLSADVDEGSGSEELTCQFTGEETAIAFNGKYLADGLKSLGCGEVIISMNEPAQPVVIAPVSGDDWQYLVMPIQVRS
jgi:DNA polymerase-3 subunit beta